MNCTSIKSWRKITGGGKTLFVVRDTISNGPPIGGEVSLNFASSLSGGNWSNGASSGSVALNGNNSLSNANANYGGSLLIFIKHENKRLYHRV